MNNSDFAIGQTVFLKSGGPPLTVSSPPEEAAAGVRVEVTWIDAGGKVCKAWFLIAMLDPEW
jgi:uncharacterized protein YodC (DUF2158 family)